jgi:hypothetical protein
MRSRGVSGLATAFACLGALLAFSGSAGAAGQLSPSQAPDQFDGGHLNGVVARTSSDVWAVGNYEDAAGVQRTLIKHWDGTRWHRLATPNPGGKDGSGLGDVDADSASDAWAVGSYEVKFKMKSLVLHWDGSSWQQVPSPNSHNPSFFDYFGGVRALSPTDVWLVGAAGFRPMTWHWDGSAWQRVGVSRFSRTHFAFLQEVTAASPSDIWAVGSYGRGAGSRTLAEHWDGSRWHHVPTPSPGDGAYTTFWSVDAAATDDVWAVGDSFKGSTDAAVIEHWDGTQWSVATPKGLGFSQLFGVTARAGDDAWASGSDDAGGLMLHWDGTSWSPVAIPNQKDAGLERIDADARDDAWVVGGQSDGSGDGVRLLDHWNGHRWTAF